MKKILKYILPVLLLCLLIAAVSCNNEPIAETDTAGNGEASDIEASGDEVGSSAISDVSESIEISETDETGETSETSETSETGEMPSQTEEPADNGSDSPEPADDFYMNGNGVLCLSPDIGLSFSATVLGTQMAEWQDSYTVELGMAIMPYAHLEQYGELNAENLFGENAVYSSSAEDGKVQITLYTFNPSSLETDTNGNYVIKGVLSLSDGDSLGSDYTARAFVKLSGGGSERYVMAEYPGDSAENVKGNLGARAKAEYLNHLSVKGGVRTEEEFERIEEIVKKLYPEVLEITNVAVLKVYEKTVTADTNIGWLGTCEDDRVNIFAWYDLGKLYSEITGRELSFTFVENISELDSDKKYIVMGCTLAEQSGLDYDGITTDNGHKIVKKNGNLYLYGKNGYGTANAMYAFLKQAFGAAFYTDTVYTTNGSASYLYGDIAEDTFNPSVDNQWMYDGILLTENGTEINYAYQLRLGFVNYWHILGGNIHGFSALFTESQYPDYYNNGVVDLNSAGEINTSNSMVKTVADWLYARISASTKTVYAFGPADIRKWSQSDASLANLEKYGANSGEYLLFMNAVVELLNTDPDYSDIKQADILMLAYNEVLAAPTKALDELKLDSSPARGMSLKLMFAPVEMNINDKPTEDYLKDFYKGTPAYYYEEYAKWQEIFDEDDIYFWRYSAGFRDFFVPVNIIEHMQANYLAIVGEDNYIGHMMDQGANVSAVQTGFQALAVYLKGELGRNVHADVDTLIDNFLQAYYGKKAAPYMKQLLLAQQEHSAKLKAVMNSTFRDVSGCTYYPDISGLTSYNIFGSKYWGRDCTDDGGELLKEWYGYIESALENTTNRTLEKRIKVEAISIRYMCLKVYGTGVFVGDSLEKVKSDATALGITMYSEGSSIDKMPTE